MNQTLKMAIGAAIGGVVGYFAASVAVDYMHMVEDAKNQPYDASDEMPDTDDEEESRYDQFRNNQRPIEMSKQQKTTKTVRTDYSAYFTPEEKIGLQELAAKYNDGVLPPEPQSETVIEEVDETPELIDTGDEPVIGIITMADFANSQYEYEQVTLSYYEDDVVTDEQDNPIPDPEKFLGEEALVSFGQGGNDENVVYVRNHDRKTEYEIIHARCPYILTEPKRPARRVAPRSNTKENDEGEED